MYKIIVLFIFSLFFTSCSYVQSKPPKGNEKAFLQEDMYILFALRAEQIGDYNSASELFETLYEKSNKKEYIYRSLQNDLTAKSYDKVIQRVNKLLKDAPYDAKLVRLKIVALFETYRLDEAIKLSTELASKTKEPNDYLLTSEIYKKRGEFDLAVRYLESAYAKEHNEKILDQMSIVLYVNLDRKKEAIAHLETHSRILGCSQLVCLRLIAFYSNDNNIDGLLSTYLRYYEINATEEVAHKIVQIYSYKKDYKNLISFLEKSNSDDEVLLQLYSSMKKYKKAYLLADKLYRKTADINYLGESAIFEYESQKGKKSKELLNRVIKKLEKVIAEENQPMYLNYLGYILIDHDIDVKNGMNYIKEVLKIDPNSAFYLDSLAWGYYKLGQCKKADEIISKVRELEGGNDPEVLLHQEEIDKCLKNIKVNSR